LSNRGTVAANRSLDCLSVFALTVSDAAAVLDVAESYDAADPWSRQGPSETPRIAERFRFAVPADNFLEFSGDGEGERLFLGAKENLIAMGGEPVAIDYTPFLEINDLLFKGAFVAERAASIGRFPFEHPEALHPATRDILEGAARYSGVDAFAALHRLQGLRRQAETALSGADFLTVPTAPVIWTIAEVEADPLVSNSTLGRYTTFVNFLDMAAIAVPSGFRSNGLPAGITLIGRAFADRALAALAAIFQRRLGLPLGATGHPLPST
jgi:allophanate hydrolase